MVRVLSYKTLYTVTLVVSSRVVVKVKVRIPHIPTLPLPTCTLAYIVLRLWHAELVVLGDQDSRPIASVVRITRGITKLNRNKSIRFLLI